MLIEEGRDHSLGGGFDPGCPVRIIQGLRDPDVQRSYYYVDTGLIAANVYLFAAACGLAAWFHNCDRSALFKKLGLRDDQRVLFAQTVGYAK